MFLRVLVVDQRVNFVPESARGGVGMTGVVPDAQSVPLGQFLAERVRLVGGGVAVLSKLF